MSDQFRQAIAAAGLTPPDTINPGHWHKFPGTQKHGKNKAAYCFMFDDMRGGVFGDFSSGMETTWQAENSKPYTAAEREAHRQRIKAMQVQRDADQAQRHQSGATEAARRWQAATACTQHTYLSTKGVQGYGLRIEGDTLLIPMRDTAGALHSLQTITPDGDKRFLSGGKVKGCYHSIGKPDGVLIVGEGYATCASLRAATGHAVAVAFNAGNLGEVATALRGKYPALKIILAADDDHQTEGNPGMSKATAAALTVGGLVAVPSFPADRPDNATDFNDLHQLAGLAAVKACIDTAIESKATQKGEANDSDHADLWPELDAIPDETTTAPDAFPFHALGPLMGNAARSIAQDVQAPDSLAGGSVLAAASLAVQSLANVMLPHGQRSPLSVFVITGAGSGDRKSAVDAVACNEVEAVRKQQAREFSRLMEQYEVDMGTRNKKDPEPPKPTPKSLTTGNATIEGISRLLKHQSSVGVFSAEGGEMLGGHSLRDDKRSSGLAFYLKGWSGESLDSLRGGDGLTVLLGRRMAMHVLVQPVLLGALLGDPLAQGQGLLARCLIAQPDTLAGHRPYRDVNPHNSPAVVAYNHAIKSLLETAPVLWAEGDGYELKPQDLYLTDDAKALWIAFYDEIERQQGNGSELEGARPFASKAAEHAARIAGIITLVQDPAATRIPSSAMDGGIELTAFYLTEHIRLTGAGRQERIDGRLRTLLAWFQSSGKAVQKKDVLQKSPYALRKLKSDGLSPLIEELVNRGYIRDAGKVWEVRSV